MSPKTAIKSDAEEPRPLEEQVAILAYRLWQERGCPEGSPEVDWLQAEQELQQTEK
jgi:hypothetical protein